MKTIFAILMLVVILPAFLHCVQGLRCAICEFEGPTYPGKAGNRKNANNSNSTFSNANALKDLPVPNHPSCAQGENVDPSLIFDCSMHADIVAAVSKLTPGSPVDDLEMQEYLKTSPNREYVCTTTFVREKPMHDTLGIPPTVVQTLRLCLEKERNFTEILNEIRKEPESDEVTGYRCETELCNLNDDEHIANSSSSRLDWMENGFILIISFLSLQFLTFSQQ